MSKLVPFDEKQMAFLLNWFVQHDKKKKGKVNAQKTIFALRKDKTFASLFRLAEANHNPESAELFSDKDVENCWKMHIPNEKVNFPQFVRLVALFARQLDSNELRSAPSGKGPSAAIVCDPPRLKGYLANPDAPRDYVPFALNYEKRIYSYIYPPTGNIQEQPCCACCGCGYILGCVMTIGCSPCLACAGPCRTCYSANHDTGVFNDTPWSLLHWAVWYGNEESIKMLVKREASVDLATNASPQFPCRATPYDLAVYLKKTRKDYAVSEQTLRKLEPAEMKAARELLKSSKIPAYKVPAGGAPVAGQSGEEGMATALAPAMVGDMTRDDGDGDESRSLGQKLEDGADEGFVEATEDAIKSGIKREIKDALKGEGEEEEEDEDDGDDGEDEPEEEEEEEEEELDEDAQEMLEAATSGFFTGFIKGFFGF